jgi:hypothetical protein
LPKDLQEAYDEIYAKIQRLHRYEQGMVDRAFQWVLSSIMPLTSNELLAAILQDPTSDEFVPVGDMTEHTLLELSNNLLVLDPQRKIWRFAHLSVAEYLEENHWSQARAHANISKVCLLWLLHTPIGITDSPLEHEIRDSSDGKPRFVDRVTRAEHITRYKLVNTEYPVISPQNVLPMKGSRHKGPLIASGKLSIIPSASTFVTTGCSMSGHWRKPPRLSTTS